MPLTLRRSGSNARLWEECAATFLDELGGGSGPPPHPSHLWLAHRSQRDLLLDAAEARGLPGWLDPPFSFLSELPRRFDIERRPVGLLAGRLLVARLAREAARRHGFEEIGGGDLPARGHMVDRTLSELLPEGIGPDELRAALDELPADDFVVRRNAWLLETYSRYLERLETAGQFDPRAVHALVADRVEGGGLEAAIGGARRLHIYGIVSLRGRQRLFEALARQSRVDVTVYLPEESGPSEWDPLAASRESLRGGSRARPIVQPAPDAVRESEWVAREVKRLLVTTDIAPHRVAVIARSGREDTRRVHEALVRAGVPATARLRARLHAVPALRALLQLFAAVAEEWRWAPLRAVLGNPYLGEAIDLRPIDLLASRDRPRGLEAWLSGLEAMEEEARSDRAWILARSGVTTERLRPVVQRLEALRDDVRPLAAARPERSWIEVTRQLLRGRPLGLRDSVCTPVEDRRDIVRLDQRAVLAVDELLREWRELAAASDRAVEAGEWHERLRRLLEANEIAISSPQQRGVQVLEAHEAALTPFVRSYIIHANDGVFPPPGGGGLFTDTERERLAAAGLPVSTRAARLERERRLWLSLVGTEEPVVTYRTADAGGVPRLASLFVPAHDRQRELGRTRLEIPGAASGEEPVTPADHRNAEAARFLRVRRSGRSGTFDTPDPEGLRRAALRACAEALRRGDLDDAARALARERAVTPEGDPEEIAAALFGIERPLSQRPSPWNGEIRDPAILSHLERRYGPDREWSVTRLEQYARRPFDFLLQRVLGLEEIERADDEANRLTIGGLVHAILEAFYRPRVGTPPDGFDAGAARQFETAFDQACAAYEADEARWVGLPHVWSATREALRERLRAFLEWELSERGRGTPLRVELAFGARGEHPAVDLSGPGRDGRLLPLSLGGRIDRVDRLDDGGLRVIDYKSGGASGAPSGAAFADGVALQAPLYMAAVRALGLGEPVAGSYRTVRAPADRARRTPRDIDPGLILAREIAARVRAGRFEAVQAGSTPISDWQPGREITRTEARLESGDRFDAVSWIPLPGAPDGGRAPRSGGGDDARSRDGDDAGPPEDGTGGDAGAPEGA